MSEKISRRAFTAAALGAALAPVAGRSQETKKPAELLDLEIEGDMTALQRKLAKPLGEKAKELTRKALENNKKALKDRREFALPENSEPCFVYEVTPAGPRP